MAISDKKRPFRILFGVVLGTAVLWLALGLLPALASIFPDLHDALHRWGAKDGLFSRVALNAAHSSHNAEPGWQILLDYVFSVFNLGLAILIVKLRPRDRNVQLLSIALVGTAVAFNLQGHDALQVVPPEYLGPVDAWHAVLHVASGLCYIFALLLFPEGRLTRRGPLLTALQVPVLGFVALVFTMLSILTTEDHTFGLVMVFGIFIPLAGVGAQIYRYITIHDEERRQQSRILLWALALALATALPLAIFTTSPGPGPEARTVDYEVTLDDPGSYFFRCDPHPVDMVGGVNVVAGGAIAAGPGDGIIEVSARDNLFEEETLTLEAGRETIIRFTNFDADLHNVAIYESSSAAVPLFIGEEFSGNNAAAFAFRAFRLIFAVIPIALFVGLIRFRLWDVDRVINRTLVYGLLIGTITAAYLGLVVGIGAAIGAGRRTNIVLSVAVTAVVALAFQPLRERARRLANRVVYGRRATPYEILSEFSERIGETYAIEDVLPEMARTLGEGTRAERAEVWLRIDSTLVLSGAWPKPERSRSLAMTGDELPELPDVAAVAPVRHQDELLGALAVTKASGNAMTPVEDRLLHDLASQAGLILRNARLAAELQARLQELKESRQRIVSAQDEERRRLERNIHDGAQQHLVAMSLKLRMAQDLAAKDPDRARRILEEVQGDTTDTLESLRDLARGIYPPVLADRGVAPALEAHARRCPIEVRVEDAGLGRHDPDVESAMYFCCLEAIQNSIKHGHGPIRVLLERSRGDARFSVIDPGPGFDASTRRPGTGIQNMVDRVSALGGTLAIDSRPGSGTVVTGWIPSHWGQEAKGPSVAPKVD